ncbi:MAG TPA: pantoate--beta-alanine ligase [Ilumatobacteraceae bacterium]|nr:pantoate--beta-alanine ligase [Ilumatobacteraceae bacterium]
MAIPTIIDTPADMRGWSRNVKRAGSSPHADRRIALVPTMGALHAGHLALIEAAHSLADVVVVSIFVNPLQFGESIDFTGYPRPIDADLAACAEAAVDVVYAPSASVMYPSGFDTRVLPGRLATMIEGSSRPGHFEGVATVVTKLIAAVMPDVAVFGEKDFQQVAVVRRMVADLDLGVEVVGCPTVRELDGLALSSRNQRLTSPQRAAAAVIPLAIEQARRTARRSDASVGDIIGAATSVVAAEPLASLDYVSVFDAGSLDLVETIIDADRMCGRYRIAIAARFGDVRLIDNADLFAR